MSTGTFADVSKGRGALKPRSPRRPSTFRNTTVPQSSQSKSPTSVSSTVTDSEERH